MRKYIITFALIILSFVNLKAQELIYFVRNDFQKLLFISYTNDLNKAEQAHKNGLVSLTKNWTYHNVEHFETVEDKSEATYFINTLDKGRIEIPRGYTLISDIKNNSDINDMLDRVNKKANSQVRYNQYQGNISEKKVEDVLKEHIPKSQIVRQVYLTNGEGKTFIDIAYLDSSNNLILLEVKSSQEAGKTYYKSKQKKVHDEIEKNGAELRSDDVDVLSFFKQMNIQKGDRIKPTKVIPVIYD